MVIQEEHKATEEVEEEAEDEEYGDEEDEDVEEYYSMQPHEVFEIVMQPDTLALRNFL